MKPTVGRSVHYVNGFDVHEAAIITHVHDDSETVNLVAWTKDGVQERHIEAQHDEDREPYTWHWQERVDD